MTSLLTVHDSSTLAATYTPSYTKANGCPVSAVASGMDCSSCRLGGTILTKLDTDICRPKSQVRAAPKETRRRLLTSVALYQLSDPEFAPRRVNTCKFSGCIWLENMLYVSSLSPQMVLPGFLPSFLCAKIYITVAMVFGHSQDNLPSL